MGKVKLFWKTECPLCGSAKVVGGKLQQEGIPVFDYNLDTTDGLAEASYYGVMSTPTIIIEDEEENAIAFFAGQVPTATEVKSAIAQRYQ